MLFNSVSFAFFLPVVFLLYWFVFKKNLTTQNLLLLAASYFFYACWDWRFLFLLVFSTALDYFSAVKIDGSKKNVHAKFWLWASIIINLGFLAVFKYYNFFAGSFAQGLEQLGFKAGFVTLNVILPVGISFYTFHGLSYIIDVYYKRITPERNFIDYAVFVSFFPLLVAGPIERATHLLPQVKKKRSFEYSKATDGLRQILWGLVKKVVVADNAAKFADHFFASPESFGGSTLLLGAVFFAVQIYCDFSGYSDIAIGTAKLFGIDLLRNFSYPYFSRNIAEFWRRWHISLSSWFRDYVYIPMGGSRGSKWKTVANIFVIFVVSGLWHGANWTFIAWGLLNAIYILPSVLIKSNRNYLNIVAEGKYLPSFRELFSMGLTFFLTVMAWIFFRSPDMESAIYFISRIFSGSILLVPNGYEFLGVDISIYAMSIIIALFFLLEWAGREQHYAIKKIAFSWPVPMRWAMYFTLILSLFYFGGTKQEFIYFQF